MAGYYGHSMSNNAIAAYEEGLKPASKWSKKEIIEELVNNNVDARIVEAAKGCVVEVLREHLLQYSEWHHTSARYNMTGFFHVKLFFKNVDEQVSVLNNAQMLFKQQKAAKTAEKQKKELENCKRAKVKYSTTSMKGFRHDYEVTGIIKGNWCFLADGHKKNINSKGFEVLEVADETLAPDFDVKAWQEEVEDDTVCVYPNYEDTPQKRFLREPRIDPAEFMPRLKAGEILLAKVCFIKKVSSTREGLAFATGVLKDDKCYLEGGKYKLISGTRFLVQSFTDDFPEDFDLTKFLK